MSFPRDRGHLSPSSYLSVLLLAAVRAYGGETRELRFDADMLETIEQNQGIITDWDSRKQQLVVRAASSHAEHLIVPEQPWSPTSAPQPSSHVSSTKPNLQSIPTTAQLAQPPLTQQPIALDDAKLAKLEEVLAVHRRNKMAQERQRAAEIISQMPQPPSTEFTEDSTSGGKKIV